MAEIPEFGSKTIAGLRAEPEPGEVARFSNYNQIVAYAGLDLTVKESGKWKGQVKISRRGSSWLRRLLYMAALASLWQTLPQTRGRGRNYQSAARSSYA